MQTEMAISICMYKNGEFDIIFETKDGRQVTFSGTHNLTPQQGVIAYEIAAPCTFTRYTRTDQ